MHLLPNHLDDIGVALITGGTLTTLGIWLAIHVYKFRCWLCGIFTPCAAVEKRDARLSQLWNQSFDRLNVIRRQAVMLKKQEAQSKALTEAYNELAEEYESVNRQLQTSRAIREVVNDQYWNLANELRKMKEGRPSATLVAESERLVLQDEARRSTHGR